jgi:type II secretory ATPase GspE/PulE/Tfp pilus assembly ATPase PilB-like protein
MDEVRLRSLGLRGMPPGALLYEPAGCAACGHLGYNGRVGIHEMLEITPEMRRLSPDRLEPETLRRLAGGGYYTLRESAVTKLLAGVTSVEEVLTITVDD